MPRSIGVGVFHQRDPDLRPKTGRKGDALVTIALTKLNSATGWFDLLEGSHRSTSEHTSISDFKRASFDLSPGDAVIWRGDLSYMHTPGGGGKFETLVYNVNE